MNVIATTMRIVLAALAASLLLPVLAQAQVYRCEGPEGPVFAGRPCADDAQALQLDNDSQGIGGLDNRSLQLELAAKRQAREQRRQVARLYAQRDAELRRSNTEIARLRAAQGRAQNNLAGATYAAGLDQQIAALQLARVNTETAYREIIVNSAGRR